MIMDNINNKQFHGLLLVILKEVHFYVLAIWKILGKKSKIQGQIKILIFQTHTSDALLERNHNWLSVFSETSTNSA